MAETKQTEKNPAAASRQRREVEARERVAKTDLVSGQLAVTGGLAPQMLPENQDDSVKYTIVGSTGTNRGLAVPYGENLPAATVPGASVPVAAERGPIVAYPTGGHLPADTREATVVRDKG